MDAKTSSDINKQAQNEQQKIFKIDGLSQAVIIN